MHLIILVILLIMNGWLFLDVYNEYGTCNIILILNIIYLLYSIVIGA